MHALFEEEIALAEKQLQSLKKRYNVFKAIYNEVKLGTIVVDLHTNRSYRVIDKSSDKLFVAEDVNNPHIKKLFFYLAQNWTFASNKYFNVSGVNSSNSSKQPI